jgi:hypothetical protein
MMDGRNHQYRAESRQDQPMGAGKRTHGSMPLVGGDITIPARTKVQDKGKIEAGTGSGNVWLSDACG